MSEAINRSTVYISQIETGSRKPSLETVFKISMTLNVGMDALFQDATVEDENAKIAELVVLLKGRTEEEIVFVTAIVKEMLKHMKDKYII